MKLFLTFTTIIFGAVFTLAQERVIEQAEFESALKGTGDHRSIWKGQPYRMTNETSARVAGKPDSDHSATILIEFGPNGNRRTVHTSRHGGKTTTGETLLIGDLSFSKTNGGPWSKTAPTPKPAVDDRPVKADKPILISTAYFFVGTKPFMETTATVYRKVESRRKTDDATGLESSSMCTNIYWLVEGVQRKYELTCQHQSPTFSSTNVISSQWDLDPAITFNAPL